MKDFKQLFHKVSYLQYPFMLGALWFYISFFRTDDWSKMNQALILFGIAISFATLQDTKKLLFSIEKKIWGNPKKGRRFIIYTAFLIFIFFAFGIFGYFFASESIIKEVSIGLIVVGIGFIGLLKTSVELFENYREDKATIE